MLPGHPPLGSRFILKPAGLPALREAGRYSRRVGVGIASPSSSGQAQWLAAAAHLVNGQRVPGSASSTGSSAWPSR